MITKYYIYVLYLIHLYIHIFFFLNLSNVLCMNRDICETNKNLYIF